MPTPLPQLVPPHWDLMFHTMRTAYEGDTETWKGVTCAMRDAIVDYAARRSPYYRRVLPRDGSFEDFPVLTKEDIRKNLDEMVVPDVPEERRLLQKTAGSTGAPLIFYRDIAQQLIENTASDRFFRWLHGVPMDATIVAVIATAKPAEPYTRWGRFLERTRSRLAGLTPRGPWMFTMPMLDIGPEDVQRQLAIWGRFDKAFLIGNSGSIDWMAELIERQVLDLPRPPVAVAATSDTLTELARERIQRVFRAPVHTRYGSMELSWLAASIPGTVDEYLFNPLLAYVEILNADGQPCPPGEPGRIVLTDLNNRVMPLIRYDQGDLAVASPRGYVGGFPVIDRLLGRSSEVLRLPSGKIFSASTMSNLLVKRNPFAPWLRLFQCAQTGRNELELRIVWARPADERVRAGMIETVRTAADPDTTVTIKDVDDVERLPSGKMWIVRRLDE